MRLLAAASLGLVLTSGVSAAEKASPSKKSKAASAATAEKGVEALAEIARRSVVVITHFGRDGREDGVGAGFVVASNGLIATSLHVIGEARPVQAQLADGKRYEVTEVHAWDRQLDLAVIRVDAAGLPALPLGDSDALRQGTPVVAMGNPLGLEHSIVQGVVSAKREFDGVEMIQLAIPVEPGNSGGPLLDLQGRVQGIITLKAMSANLGFAMPINALKPLLQRPNPVPMNRWLTLGALNPREWSPLLGARWSKKAGRIQVDGPGSGFGGRSLCLWRKDLSAGRMEQVEGARRKGKNSLLRQWRIGHGIRRGGAAGRKSRPREIPGHQGDVQGFPTGHEPGVVASDRFGGA